jgi:hypothetical protein
LLLEFARPLLGSPSPQERLHGRPQFVRVEGFGQIAIRTATEPLDAFLNAVPHIRDEQDGCQGRCRLSPELPADAVAVPIRQADIEQDEIGRGG